MKKIVLAILSFTLLFANNQKVEDIQTKKLNLLKEINSSFFSSDFKKMYKLYTELAFVYKKNEEYYKALEYYKLALKLFPYKKHSLKKIKLYRNLAFCYKKLGDTYKTFKYTYQAVKLADKIFGKKAKLTKELTKEVAAVQSELIAASIF